MNRENHARFLTLPHIRLVARFTIHHTIRDAEYGSRSNRLPNGLSLTISIRTVVSTCAQVSTLARIIITDAQKLGSTPRGRFNGCNMLYFYLAFFLIVNYSNPPSFRLYTREPAASQLIGNRKIPSFQPRINPPTFNSLFVYRQYVGLPYKT